MLSWMRLCPGFTPGTKYLNSSSTTKHAIQVRSVSNNFRKCFMVLLDLYGDDLRLLQRASMIAAQKGYWGVLQSTLAQILRFGVGRLPGQDVSNPELAWEYFHRLTLANQSQRGLKDEARRREILASTNELRRLYNLGVRTLALAGRLDDAVHWARKARGNGNGNPALAHILVVEGFTQNLLLEELVKADGGNVEQARSLADELSSAVGRSSRSRAMDVDAIVARVEREASFKADESDHAQRGLSQVDAAIQAWLEQGDVVAAREYLLSVLRLATRVRSEHDDAPPDHASNDSTFAHLPSARTLSEMQDIAHKLGTMAVTSSLTETDMHQAPDDQDVGAAQESLTAKDFLRPIRSRLLSVRGGKGLWETARLYGFVKKGKWREAAQFYIGKSGFKVPSGGITHQLVSLALDQPSPSPSSNDDVDQASATHGKHWPSTHAINLMLKALTNLCIDAKDYERLCQVYTLWKDASLPTRSSSLTEDLVFEQWPPSQRPSSRTFDPFVRAFGRIDVELQSGDAKVDKQAWGSSGAMMHVIRDMTDVFRVRPGTSTWTIALECLAREGRGAVALDDRGARKGGRHRHCFTVVLVSRPQDGGGRAQLCSGKPSHVHGAAACAHPRTAQRRRKHGQRSRGSEGRPSAKDVGPGHRNTAECAGGARGGRGDGCVLDRSIGEMAVRTADDVAEIGQEA